MGTNCEYMRSLFFIMGSIFRWKNGRDWRSGRAGMLSSSLPPCLPPSRLSFLFLHLTLPLAHTSYMLLVFLRCRSVQAHTQIQILSHALPSPTTTSPLASTLASSTTAVDSNSTTEGWSLALVPATSQIGLIPQSYFTVSLSLRSLDGTLRSRSRELTFSLSSLSPLSFTCSMKVLGSNSNTQHAPSLRTHRSTALRGERGCRRRRRRRRSTTFPILHPNGSASSDDRRFRRSNDHVRE